MAKDPAFLFYSSDFMMGTALMNEMEVGQYIRILCQMHQSGHLSIEDMKNICPNISSKVVAKFRMDGNGLYFNERLDQEVVKRKNYSESRRKNRLQNKKETHDPSYDNHMSVHMENENENRNEIKIVVKKGVQGETLEERLTAAFDEIYIDEQAMKWSHLDFNFELESFRNKVIGSPEDYDNHDRNGIRKAFQYQLRNSKGKPKHGQPTSTNKGTEHAAGLVAALQRDRDKLFKGGGA
jgi:uncharacterized protein YdaU (DUF1376 family)